MTFTTPCFVRVENPEKRKELIEWLEGIGYKFLMRGLESNVLYVDVTSGCLLCANEGKNGVRKFDFNEPSRFDSFVDVPSGYYRKATAEEIVEYFKNKEL